MALRGWAASAMPSGGDTGSIASSLLPRADVLLGSGDLSGERVPAVVRVQHSLPRNDAGRCHSLNSPPNAALLDISVQPLLPQRAGRLLFWAVWATRGLFSNP